MEINIPDAIQIQTDDFVSVCFKHAVRFAMNCHQNITLTPVMSQDLTPCVPCHTENPGHEHCFFYQGQFRKDPGTICWTI